MKVLAIIFAVYGVWNLFIGFVTWNLTAFLVGGLFMGFSLLAYPKKK